MSEAGARVVDGSWIVDTVGTHQVAAGGRLCEERRDADIGIMAGLEAAAPGLLSLR